MIINMTKRKLNLERMQALFFSGIHIDMAGRMDQPGRPGVSNPGKFKTMPGGASLNAASLAAQLGLSTSIIGKIGKDTHGKMIEEALEQRKIRNLLEHSIQSPTGIYVSIIEPGGDINIALADLQLNETLDAQWLFVHRRKAMQDHPIWCVNANMTADTLLGLCGPSAPIRPKLLAAASISPAKAKNLISCLPHLDLLLTNLSEARAILKQFGDYPRDTPQQCAKSLSQLGVTCGTLSCAQKPLIAWNQTHWAQIRVPSPVTMVDVTGAGDSIVAAILSGLGEGMELFECLPRAVALAQMVLQYEGPFIENLNLASLQKAAAQLDPPTLYPL